jgi:hypothetical protein
MRVRHGVYLACALIPALLIGAAPERACAETWRTFGKHNGLPETGIGRLAVDPGGHLWISFQGSADGRGGGLTVMDRVFQCAAPYTADDGLRGSPTSGIAFEPVAVEHLEDYRHGAVWIATDSGISVLDRRGAFTSLTPRTTPLPGTDITALHIDRENTRWIAVKGGGVSCVDAEFTWAAYTAGPDGLCSNHIISIQEDSLGRMWFGSGGRGASMLSREGAWQHFSSENSGLIGNHVSSIIAEPPNRLWFVTTQGISVFDGQNWMSYTSRNSPLGTHVPVSMVIDATGTKWIGTRSGGIFRLDRSGMWTHYHTGNSRLPDNAVRDLAVNDSGGLWAATAAGLCAFGVRFPDGAAPHDNGPVQPFTNALMWERLDASDSDPQLTLALPACARGGTPWLYAAVWEDRDFSFKDLSYSIIGDRLGNRTIQLSGTFSQTLFLISGAQAGKAPAALLEYHRPHPFPAAVADAQAGLLLPGRGIPSDDPEVIGLAASAVRAESRMDMGLTMRDIVYSRLVQHLLPEDTGAGRTVRREPGEERSRISPVKNVSTLLKDRAGDSHAKARLICALLRAAGVPARILMNITGQAWCQAWIAGAGWVSIDARYPVYDYMQPWRTSAPKIPVASDHALAWVSGRNDEAALLSWHPGVKAYYTAINPAELAQPHRIARARLLITRFVTDPGVPNAAGIPVGTGLFAVAQQERGNSLLLFQDAAGKTVASVPLVFDGATQLVNVRDTLFWKFIPRIIGDMLVIENIECVTR